MVLQVFYVVMIFSSYPKMWSRILFIIPFEIYHPAIKYTECDMSQICLNIFYNRSSHIHSLSCVFEENVVVSPPASLLGWDYWEGVHNSVNSYIICSVVYDMYRCLYKHVYSCIHMYISIYIDRNINSYIIYR